MKYILLSAIKAYQALMPKRFRSKCLFKESCSNHVLRITKEKGFMAGMQALQFRFNNCRPGYFIIENGVKKLLVTAKKQVIEEEYLDERIFDKQR